jgi:PAS domain S-box-containing protein
VHIAIQAIPIGVLIAVSSACVVSIVLAIVISTRSKQCPEAAFPPHEDVANFRNYKLILDALERSNVLLWWAHVTRIGAAYSWKIRTPPQLGSNRIFRLASLVKQDWLWKDEQSPDHERMNRTSTKALAEGASGYQQEFPIIGLDTLHWLSEEVTIRTAGPNEWNLVGVIVDVTKRHLAEEAQKQTEGQLGQILNSADCLIWKADVTEETDTQLKWHVFVPPSALLRKIFGEKEVPQDELLWSESMVPEWAEIRETASRAIRNGDASYEQVFHVVTPGYIFCLHENVSITRVESGKWGLVGVIIDITERRRAEEALKREEVLFSNLVNTTPDRIYFKDRSSRFIRINSAMARDFGLRDSAEALGKTDFDIFSEEHARQALSDEQRIMETGDPMIGVEEKETWPDGRLTWVSTTKMALRDTEGKITGIVGISRDVTERRSADAQLREHNEILSNSHEGVMIVNLANRITLWNRAAEKIVGWSQSEALGRDPVDLLFAGDPKKLFALRSAAVRDGYWTGELQAKTRDGRNITIESRVTLVRDESNLPRGRLNLFADVTEKKLAEEKLVHAQRIEGIGMLAAGIAHDLNNMLAPIVFAVPLLRPSLFDPEDLKILDSVEKSAARGASLVKQILGFAQGSGSKFQPTQVRHLVKDIVNLVEQTFPKSIELAHTFPADLWTVQGDSTQIHQVLLNLCVNARDAMRLGGTLTVAAANRHLNEQEASSILEGRAGNWVVLEVGDTGTGIPPEVLEHIWTPFFTTKSAGKGSGLGLSTVRGIVANHGGFVELLTKAGCGTTFRVYFPAIENAPSDLESAPPFEVPEGRGELILLVDDDAAIRHVGTAILEKSGYHVLSCVDGIQALDVFRARAAEISLVISDVDMPRLGGTELALLLARIRPDVKIIAMSGLYMNKVEDSDVPGTRTAARTFLIKPFKAADLLRTVHRLLHPNDLPKTAVSVLS